MNTDVKNFVEAYNTRMGWNRDILKNLNIMPSQFNVKLRKFLSKNLSIDNITEDGFDLENAKVYTYDDGTLELQAFDNETYGISYFWCKPTESETEYKVNRILHIQKELDKDIDEKKAEIDKLTSEFADVVVLRKMFKNYE